MGQFAWLVDNVGLIRDIDSLLGASSVVQVARDFRRVDHVSAWFIFRVR